jgi:glycogen phosphorylase
VAPKRISEKQIEGLIKQLHELAHNLWRSWNPAGQRIFKELSPFFWEDSNHNAVEVMNFVSGQEMRGRLQDPEFFAKVDVACRSFQEYMKAKTTWGSKNTPWLKTSPVAYFSAEFGIHESLRIYSGGLGILAGDHAKSASDLGVPLVGISIFYRQGYFRQQISREGWQQEKYPTFDPERLPVRRVLDKRGNPVVCSVQIGSTDVTFQAWVAEVGRVKLYLLDTNLPQNGQFFRDLSAHVYGGDQSNRIGQEILLGIGGVRLMRKLGIQPSVFHMNEGHSAFLTLELLREQLQAKKALPEAEAIVRKQCAFTTHTPVPAGHDRFDRGLMEGNLGKFATSMGMSIDDLMNYGRIHNGNQGEPFCMTVLALKMCRSANGVSELHGRISQEMWKELFPDVPVHKVPIGAVTNGVHTMGWTSPTATQFWNNHLGPQWIHKLREAKYWHAALETKKISDQDLWALRTSLRRELIEFARKRLREQQLRHNPDDIGLYDNVLSPDTLTICFARRFATYKRAPLFFRDLGWAIRTLSDKDHPVQLVFAGKAHPRDDAGKHFIQEIINITKRVDLFGRVVFLEDYDINVARYMVAGADIWLNTPRRPMEACGTSGMKGIMHGALNFSTMDGWWREAYDGMNGWKIGEDTTASSDQMQDDLDAASLRAVLENQIVPLYYDRGKDGIPRNWLRRVRHSIASLLPVYNTDRMVAEYAKKYYQPQPKK